MDADWSDLPPDLVVSIAKRIVCLEDFAAFGAACKSWRSKATKENFTGEFSHQVPILMLPMIEDDINPLCYSITKGRFNKLNLPEAEGNQCFSSLGWLLIAYDHAWKLTLLHPLNHTRIELPRFSNSNYWRRWKYPTSRPQVISKFGLLSSPSQSSDYTVILIYERKHLAFCRPGKDENWESIRVSSSLDITIVDLTCFNGECYVVDYLGEVFVLDFVNRIKVRRVAAPPMPGCSSRYKLYLVESAGALLVVLCYVCSRKT
ncbi:F-box protein At2g17036-like [Rosa rugosa]|uniref:F-box protein At2g17036-like n=1 Tax=Rosa rugosa TaxID=74645 RepID=UPI002B404063|nr:F-box protein At2g17036-like [Rosa rugosa]